MHIVGAPLYRLIVISDIHRDWGRLERLVPMINATDCVVCCGDGVNDFMNARGRICVPTVCVRGNNDFDTFVTDDACVYLNGIKTLVTHGHKYGVKRGTGALLAASIGKGCRLVLFGHTHVFRDESADGVRLINPGALCNGSYAVVEIDGDKITCKKCEI